MTAPSNGVSDEIRDRDIQRSRQRIRRVLKTRTSREVADAIGCTTYSVRNWELGKCAMTPKYAARVQALIREDPVDQGEVDTLIELTSGLTVRQKLALAKALVMDAMSAID